jgi:hypothetical protein
MEIELTVDQGIPATDLDHARAIINKRRVLVYSGPCRVQRRPRMVVEKPYPQQGCTVNIRRTPM